MIQNGPADILGFVSRFMDNKSVEMMSSDGASKRRTTTHNQWETATYVFGFLANM